MMRVWKLRYGLPLLVIKTWTVSPVKGQPCWDLTPDAEEDDDLVEVVWWVLVSADKVEDSVWCSKPLRRGPWPW